MMPVLCGVIVAQTWFLEAGGYEIELSPDLDATAPRTVLVTRDPEIYTMAAVAEGYPIHFDATFHQGRRRNGRRCEVLDTLIPAGTGSHRDIPDDERTNVND